MLYDNDVIYALLFKVFPIDFVSETIFIIFDRIFLHFISWLNLCHQVLARLRLAKAILRLVVEDEGLAERAVNIEIRENSFFCHDE